MFLRDCCIFCLYIICGYLSNCTVRLHEKQDEKGRAKRRAGTRTVRRLSWTGSFEERDVVYGYVGLAEPVDRRTETAVVLLCSTAGLCCEKSCEDSEEF